MTNDIKKQLIKLDIANIREQLSIINDIKTVVKSFDKKVYNKRFDEAVSKKGYRTYVRGGKEFNNLYIYSYAKNNNIQTNTKNYSGGLVFARRSEFTLLYIAKSECFGDGKRIKADVICNALDKTAERLTQEADEKEKKLCLIDFYLTKLQQIKNDYNAYAQNLHCFEGYFKEFEQLR